MFFFLLLLFFFFPYSEVLSPKSLPFQCIEVQPFTLFFGVLAHYASPYGLSETSLWSQLTTNDAIISLEEDGGYV